MADFNVGQGNDGNLQATFLDNLVSGAGNGNRIIVADNAEFFSLPNFDGLIVAGKNATGTPNIIERSATGANPPIFLNMVKSLSDAEWTYQGGGVWRRGVPATITGIWANGGSGYWGLTNGFKEVSGTPAAEYEFRAVSFTLVDVYTGTPSIAPPTYYSGVYMCKGGTACAIGFTNNSNMRVTGIMGAGGRVAFAIGHSNVASIGTPSQDQFAMEFIDVRGDRSMVHGVALDLHSTSFRNRDIDITRPYGEGGLTATTIGGIQQSNGQGNGFHAGGSFNAVDVIDYTFKHWGHSQSQIQQGIEWNPGTLTMRAGQNYGVLDGEFCRYNHSFGVTGSYPAGQHMDPGLVAMSGMKCLNQASASHVMGKARFSGFTMKSFQSPAGGISDGSGIDAGNNSIGTLKTLDVTVEAFYIENPYGYPARGYEAVTGTLQDAFRMRNGTIVDILHRGETAGREGTANNAVCSFRWWTPGPTPADQIIENVNFIVSGGNGQLLISWNNTDAGSNKFTINGKAGITSNNVENQEWYQDRVAGDYHVVAGSILATGGFPPDANSRDLWNGAMRTPNAFIGPLQLLVGEGDTPVDTSANRYDDFDRANNATSAGTPSDGGTPWVVFRGGPWGISGNRLYHTTVLDTSVIAMLGTSRNVRVGAYFYGPFTTMGVVARLADADNFLLMYALSNQVFLTKNVAGVFTPLANSGIITINSGDRFEMSADAANLITCYRNSVSLFSIVEAAGSSNLYHGLNSNDDTTQPRWDNFTIYNLGTPPAQPAPPAIWASNFRRSASRRHR